MSLARNAGKVAFFGFKVHNCLRRSCVSLARNAGKVAFFGFEVQPSAEVVRVHREMHGKVVISDFEVQPYAEIVRVHRAKCW